MSAFGRQVPAQSPTLSKPAHSGDGVTTGVNMPVPRDVFVGMTYLAEGNGPVVVHVDRVEPRV